MTGRVVCFGEILMRLSAPGRELLLQTPRLDVHFGGAEANVAVSLARLGHDAVMVSTLPSGPLGDAALGELRRHGVDTRSIRRRDGRMGVYYMASGALHRPSDIIYDRADSAFALDPDSHNDWHDLLDGATWLHTSGITPAVSAAGAEAALRAVDAAVARGVAVSLDGNYRQKLWAARGVPAAPILARLAERATLLFGNDRDVGLILGIDIPGRDPEERFARAAEAAFAAFPRLRLMAATVRGHETVDRQELSGLMADRERLYRTGTHALTGIVDRIGGGDAFAAGLLHGLLARLEPAETLDFAVAAACLKHSIPGDANLAGLADMRAFLAEEALDVRR